MANEKTEEATPRKRSKERDKGNISKSQDTTAAWTLSAGVALFFVLSPHIFSDLKALFYETFTHLNPHHLSHDNPLGVLVPYVVTLGKILLPFFLLLALAAIAVLRAQTGALFAKEALKPKIDKFYPSSMLKALGKKLNPFEPKSLMELAKSLAKLVVVGAVGVNVIIKRLDDLVALMGADLETAFVVLGSVIAQILIAICIVMIIIGLLDKKFQDYQYNKSIKMSKQEVKDEWKNMEGDPKIKGKIRSIQMQFAQQKMMGNIKEADVVVVNPTHYAVAIRYNQEHAPAPQVLAKGVDFVAFKIRDVAKANGVPIIENKPLAQSLYKLVPIGGIIPSELYVAVAELLSYVYAQKSKV
ncbi:flagellar biosynthetic protein FlhB [Candidatus Gastranaerophilus sp. (ex Termes propinquus)]|nr:flagellar biosynthetic protein FlhB [Candidatus Gastranaerophilus sp. (ex Termes propinquus)]